LLFKISFTRKTSVSRLIVETANRLLREPATNRGDILQVAAICRRRRRNGQNAERLLRFRK
jgi:hypothetical protein